MNEQVPQSVESLPSPEEQERIKLSVCRFFEEKLTALEAEAKESPSVYAERFDELCGASAHPSTPQMKEFDMAGLPIPLRVRMDDHFGYHSDQKRMSVNVEPLWEATTANGLSEAISFFLEGVYHESEHIFDQPREYDRPKEWVRYASYPEEINAFGRGFAFRYSRAYPEEPFTLERMRDLAERLYNGQPERNMNVYRYFVQFADPAVQQEYSRIVDLARVHTLIVQATESHLEKLRQKA